MCVWEGPGSEDLQGELLLLLAVGWIGGATQGGVGELTWGVTMLKKKLGRLTNPATTQAQSQGYELAHPSLYLIYEL